MGTPEKQVTPPSLPLNKGRCGGVMKFFRQYRVGPYILDFYCPTMRLAVELDGGQHNLCESKEYEAVRSEYLKAQGVEVLRFWNHEVLLDVESVLSELALKVTPSTPPLKLRGGNPQETRKNHNSFHCGVSLMVSHCTCGGKELKITETNDSRPFCLFNLKNRWLVGMITINQEVFPFDNFRRG